MTRREAADKAEKAALHEAPSARASVRVRLELRASGEAAVWDEGVALRVWESPFGGGWMWDGRVLGRAIFMTGEKQPTPAAARSAALAEAKRVLREALARLP